jgi:DNA primase
MHGLRALCDDVQAGFKVKRPRCGVGRKLAKRESRRGMKREAGQFFSDDGETRQTMHIERRLTDRGLGQFVRRAFECGLGEREAEHFVGPFEEVCGGRIFRSQILAHTDCLGPLAGKQ